MEDDYTLYKDILDLIGDMRCSLLDLKINLLQQCLDHGVSEELRSLERLSFRYVDYLESILGTLVDGVVPVDDGIVAILLEANEIDPVFKGRIRKLEELLNQIRNDEAEEV